MRLSLCLLVFLAGCDIDSYPAASPTAPTATPISITISNVNTNSASTDRTDTEPDSPSPAPSGGGGVAALPLPPYGEAVTREYAAANPGQVTHSCQLVDGEAAWAFLDGLLRVLSQRDARWGYLCKDANCTQQARDVVAYRASSGDTGIWIVDVLGNHCPGPGDSPTMVRWGVLPFETTRRWIGHR